MTNEANQVARLLKDAVPRPPGPIDYEQVVRAGRRRQIVIRGAVTLAAAACVLSATFGVPAVVREVGQPDQQVLTPPEAAVDFHGVRYPVPEGWRAVRGTPDGSSLPADKTVAIGDSALASAPPAEPLQQTVQLRSMYSDDDRTDDFYVPTFDAEEVSRFGQPGWLEVTDYESGKLVTVTLPWLNTVIAATAPDEPTARALVDRAELPFPSRKWEVNPSGSRLELRSWADPLNKPDAVTDPAKVNRILTELRALRPASSPAAECRLARWQGTYVLTVRDADGAGQAYLIRSGELCLQVNGPEGGAAELSPTLANELTKAFDLSGR